MKHFLAAITLFTAVTSAPVLATEDTSTLGNIEVSAEQAEINRNREQIARDQDLLSSDLALDGVVWHCVAHPAGLPGDQHHGFGFTKSDAGFTAKARCDADHGGQCVIPWDLCHVDHG